MKPHQLYQYILPIYLAVVMLLQIPLQVVPVLTVLAPLLLLTIAIQKKSTSLGLSGFFAFVLLAYPQIMLTSIDEILPLFLQIVFFVLPALLLLIQILQLDNTHIILFPVEKKTPLVLAGILITVIFCVVYGVIFLLPSGFMFLTTTTEGQVIFFAAVSIITCVPLLLR